MSEPLRQAPVPQDEPRPAGSAKGIQLPPTHREATSRNYWAKLDQRDFARFPAFKPLPHLEESRLFQRAQNGDIDARNILWRQHLRLAFSVVNRFYLPRTLLADAIQEAALALATAIERFDVHMYNAFSTYAWYWMEQRVRRFRISHQYGARLPAYLHPTYGRFNKGLRRCRSLTELLDYQDEWRSSDPVTFDRLSCYHALIHAGPIDDAASTAAADGDPSSAIECQETIALISAIVDNLPKREHHIITRRYGLDGEPMATLKEIGREIGLTRERVRQLEREALRFLRGDLEDRLAGRNGQSMHNRPRVS